MRAGPDGRRPAVYARLRDEAEVRAWRRPPHPAARFLGWALVGAIALAVVAAVVWGGS